MDKSILDMVHETAQDLHTAGVMKDTTLREFDALCLPPVKEYTAIQIKQIRTRNHASQGVFAAYLNTSVSTIQKWEQGQKKPNGPSLKLLNLVAEKGLEILA
ncbi:MULTISPECIES: helix-turn-helix domain-containing protein [Halomonadaceae]|jgi:putative transcriptional regulator|uniref:Transcriptional regulator n=2 Tax=Halomonadaceae TaxID=28256 RepID=A0A8H9M2G7_9GAMM|nr:MULTISPECIES: DNA-binding transcriptional regulator [Halomonas]ATH77838.1 transcriptional regulator [Halomonas hydrothermalis]KHJ50798.1 DNA-binding protein [Halomonas hydrothermalis]MDM7483138.1 DNA-binding transcriptional regulator [Halomonas sp.]NGO89594.1 helix-turn-helix domain-containing protein [Halomonas sp.]PJX13124.1 transcriptional regulator [Halomonas sp. 141]